MIVLREPEDRPLTAAERVVLTWEIYRAYARVRWLFRRDDDVRHVLARLRDVPPSGGRVEDPVRVGRRLARATVRAMRLLPADTRCLMRSLVLVRLLARRGITTTLVLGVEPGERLFAHAWVDHAGRPLLDDGAGFEPLAEL